MYAIWQNDDYIITYDSNGGTGTMAAQSAKGETAVKLTKNVFQRAGYLFTGWATDRYAMKPSYLDEAQYPNMEPEVTLYAQWRKLALDSYKDHSWMIRCSIKQSLF